MARKKSREEVEEQTAQADDPADEPESPVAPDGEPPPRRKGDEELPHFVDTARADIMSKARAVRAREEEANEEQLDDYGLALQRAQEAESRGEKHEFAIDEETDDGESVQEAAQAKAAKETPSAGVDSKGELVTIKVDGREEKVPESRVFAAGIAALQKERTGDERLKEASSYEEAIRHMGSVIEKKFTELQQAQRAAAERGTQGGDGSGNLPATGAVPEDIQAGAARVADAIYSGDADQVKDALVRVISSVGQGRQSSTPPLDASEVAKAVVDSMRSDATQRKEQQAASEYESVRQAVNVTFRTDFKDVHDDARGFRLAKAEFDSLLETEPNADPVALMRRAGKAARAILNGKIADPLTVRQNRKRAAQRETPETTTRQQPEPALPRKSAADVVRDMRIQRGQPVG